MKKLILLLLIFSNAAMAQRAVEYANDTNRAPRPGRYGLVVVDGHFYSIDSDKNLSLILQDSVIQSRVIGLVDSLVAIKATALGEEIRAKAAETALSNRITADSTRLNAEALNIDNAQADLLNHEGRLDDLELIDHDHSNKAILDGTTASFTTTLKSKIDGIESGATADQTAGEIKTAYESNANTNAFTDADESKLDGIEAGAELNNISDVNATDLTDGGASTLHYHTADRSRSNHTGTQAISSITGLQTALDGKQSSIVATNNYGLKQISSGVIGASRLFDNGSRMEFGTLSGSSTAKFSFGRSSAPSAMTLTFMDDVHGFSVGVQAQTNGTIGDGTQMNIFTGPAGSMNFYKSSQVTDTSMVTPTYLGGFLSNGNFGIGISPQNKLHVNGTAQAAKMLVNTSTDAGYQLDVNGTSRFIGTGEFQSEVYISNSGPLIRANVLNGTSGLRLNVQGHTVSTNMIRFQNNGTNVATIRLDGTIEAPTVVFTTSATPASATSACTTGQRAWDSNHIYQCIAPNTWKRTALTAW